MKPADKPAFIKQLMGLSAIKPGKDLTPAAYEIWWQAMQAWSLEDFKAAASQLARDIEFMPSPYHFEQLRKAGRPTAGEAWATVLECARKSWELPDDALLRKAVSAIGGLRAVMMSEVDKTHFLEKRFAEHYGTIQDAVDVREAVPQIAVDRRLGVENHIKQLSQAKR